MRQTWTGKNDILDLIFFFYLPYYRLKVKLLLLTSVEKIQLLWRGKKYSGLTGLTAIFLASIALLLISVCELDTKLIYAKKVLQIQQFKTEQKICFLFTICLNRIPRSDVALPKPLLTCWILLNLLGFLPILFYKMPCSQFSFIYLKNQKCFLLLC